MELETIKNQNFSKKIDLIILIKVNEINQINIWPQSKINNCVRIGQYLTSVKQRRLLAFLSPSLLKLKSLLYLLSYLFILRVSLSQVISIF